MQKLYSFLKPYLHFKYLLAVGIICGAVLFMARPAYHPGLFKSHDDVQVTRVQVMVEELRGGQFPVRYIDSFGNGAGYFLFNFYSPLVYYLGAVTVLAGFNSISAVKLVFLLIILVGASGMFVLLRSKTSLFAATWGTALFLLSPYVFHDLFHRGALPESMGLMLIPWVLWAFLQLKTDKLNRVAFVVGVIGFSLLIQAHVLTAALVGCLLLAFLYPFPTKKKMIIYLLAVSLAILLAGYYFLPATFESRFTQYGSAELITVGYKDKFIDLLGQFGFGDSFNLKGPFVGFALMVTYVMIGFFLMFKNIKSKSSKKLLLSIFAISSVCLFLISPWSTLLWEKVFLIRYLQFPYRLLTVLTVVLVLGFSILLDSVKSLFKWLMIVSLVVIPTLYYWPYFQALGYQFVDYKVEDSCKTTTWNDEYLPRWTEMCLPSDYGPVVQSSSKVEIKDLQVEKNGRSISFVPTGQANQIEVGKYYFPGWEAVDDSGNQLEIVAGERFGLIWISLTDEAMDQVVTVQLKTTPARHFGNVVTLVAGIFLVSITVWYDRFLQIIKD